MLIQSTRNPTVKLVRSLLTKKTTKRGRRLRKGGFIAECEAKKVRELIPYK